jgi:hypothetical protein
LDYIVGEDKEVYNIPSIDRCAGGSSQQKFGAAFEGLQSKASEDLG